MFLFVVLIGIHSKHLGTSSITHLLLIAVSIVTKWN